MFSKVLLSAFLFSTAAGVAYACTCGPLTQKQVWNAVDFVSQMRIRTKTVDQSTAILTYTADYIDPIYKPANQSHILIPVPLLTRSDTAACGVTNLKINQAYLITATRNGTDTFLSACLGMPPKDGQPSIPQGALEAKRITPQLKKKLETGKF